MQAALRNDIIIITLIWGYWYGKVGLIIQAHWGPIIHITQQWAQLVNFIPITITVIYRFLIGSIEEKTSQVTNASSKV